jgi:uncharacterized protein
MRQTTCAHLLPTLRTRYVGINVSTPLAGWASAFSPAGNLPARPALRRDEHSSFTIRSTALPRAPAPPPSMCSFAPTVWSTEIAGRSARRHDCGRAALATPRTHLRLHSNGFYRTAFTPRPVLSTARPLASPESDAVASHPPPARPRCAAATPSVASLLPPLLLPYSASAFAAGPALLGGVAIGLSVAVHALVLGRVTGVSGHLNRTLRGERPADALLLLGIVLGGMLSAAPGGVGVTAGILPALPARLFAAGALVAIGAVVGGGCTSGHAVCGIARLSPRSFVAAAVFLLTACVVSRATGTVALLYHAAASAGPPAADFPLGTANPAAFLAPYASVLVLQAACILATRSTSNKFLRRYACWALQVLIGVGFSIGLVCSGMAVPLKVASFFDIGRHTWDPSMGLVFPGALFFSAVAFQTVRRGKSPVLLPETHYIPAAGQITVNLVLGAALFGCGWGLLGVCPGPALALLGSSFRSAGLRSRILIWLAGYASGLFGLSAAGSVVASVAGDASRAQRL